MTAEELKRTITRLRQAYDVLSRGDRAVLRRCRDGAAVRLEGTFWRLLGVAEVPPEVSRQALADLVAAFPAAAHRAQAGFRTGRFLRDLLDPKRDGSPTRSLRFRQLVRARDREELCGRLRRLLPRSDDAVDWGVVGVDVVFLNDATRRRWVEEFFSPATTQTTDFGQSTESAKTTGGAVR